MRTVIKGKNWRVQLGNYNKTYFIHQRNGKLWQEIGARSTLLNAFELLSPLLTALCSNYFLVLAPRVNWDATTVIKDDLWRIAKQDEYLYIQTRSKKSIPWTSTVGEQPETITAFDNLEAAVLEVIKLISK